MQQWPKARDIREFYGNPDKDKNGRPDPSWEAAHLTYIPTPWRMILAWDAGTELTRMRVHKRVADSLQRVFADILSKFKSQAEIEAERLHLFGGTYAFRIMRGGTSLSTHAFGAAIDLDPVGNPLGKKWSEGMIDQRVVAAFKNEGWVWGGDFSRPDCQHFQAVRL